MKNKIVTMLKKNRIIYLIYNFVLSLVLKFIGLFIKVDEKLILFNSFGGRKYDDNTRATYEYMIKSSKYSDYKMVWALDNPDLGKEYNLNVVKNNSINFFITALKAKYWITNSSIERGLKFKKKDTIYVNMHHGNWLKKGGDFINNKNNDNNNKFNVTEDDITYVQNKFDIKVYKSNAKNKNRKYVLSGYPRNDELCNFDKNKIEIIRDKLHINKNKKIILYAPTYRDYNYKNNENFIKPILNQEKWKKELGKDYVVLFRAHYEVSKILNIRYDDFIIDVTNYQHLNDLLIISDILISDYSSIMMDYSILERPIYSYGYDFDEYNLYRGVFEEIVRDFPNGMQTSEDELLEKIKNCDFDEQKMKSRKFKEKYIEVYGNASKYIDKIILDKCEELK